jgi:ABC-2 type transport system permease protein
MYSKTFSTFWHILKTDLFKYYKKTFKDHVINSIIWVTCSLVVSSYVWPKIGMSEEFGVFTALGCLVSCAFWDAWGVTAQFVSDIEGDRVIDYYLTLPLSSRLFFVKQIVFYMLRSMGVSFLMIPISKLILGSKLSFAHFSFGKFIIIFMITNIFCATLSLLMTSLVKDMNSIDNVSMRFLFPMWFFGGAQFSWMTMYAVSRYFAYFCLCNPLLYAMEAMRVAFIGQEGYLPFWPSILMLILFSIVCGYIGIRRLVRRLGCI